MFKVTIDVKPVQRFVDDLAKQTLFATAKALTDTAKEAEKAIKGEMAKSLDRPTPFTLNSLRTKPATKANLTAEAKIKDEAANAKPPTVWLAPQVYGGVRLAKRSEERLRRAGVLAANEFVVPGQGAKLDQYGNMSRGQLQAILADMQAHWDHSQNSTATSRAKRQRRRDAQKGAVYFTPRPGSALQRGVYQRIGFGFGSAIRPVLIFVQGAPRYAKRVRFYEVGQRAVEQHFENYFDMAMREAIRTARSMQKAA